MTVDTRYNIGDIVEYFNEQVNAIRRGRIRSIGIQCDCGSEPMILYSVDDIDNFGRYYVEQAELLYKGKYIRDYEI